MRSVKWFLQALYKGELNYVVFAMAFYLVLSIIFRIMTLNKKFRNFLTDKLKISILFIFRLLIAAVFIFLSAIAKAFIESNVITIIVIIIFGGFAFFMIYNVKNIPINELK